MRLRTPIVGEPVIYITDYGERKDALCTMDWSQTCINLAFVNERGEQGEHGKPIEHRHSVVHSSLNDAKANCWEYPDGKLNLEQRDSV